MLIRLTTRRQEKQDENAAVLPVSPTVVAAVVRRIEDRTAMLDFTDSADAGVFALAPLTGRAD